MEKKVLIVDDDYFVLGLLQNMLEREGYLVDCLDNGKFLGDAVLLYNPDLILLDIMLGPIDGRDLFEDLSRDPQTSHIPVIIISASRENLTREKKVCQPAAFISKPFDIDYLRATVDRFIG